MLKLFVVSCLCKSAVSKRIFTLSVDPVNLPSKAALVVIQTIIISFILSPTCNLD